MRDPEKWPDNPVTEKSQVSEKEAKVIKEVLSIVKTCPKEEEQNEFDRLLNSHDLRRALRIQAWVRRFTTRRDRKGPLTSEDLREARDWWIRRVQNLDSKKPQFTQTRNALNLIPNSDGILECRGRIQGMYPVYLPADSTFTGSWLRESTRRPFMGEYRLQWPPFERGTGFQNSESWLNLLDQHAGAVNGLKHHL